MTQLAKLFKNRLFLALLGVIFLSLFIWFAGPLLGIGGQAPLETKANRLMAIGGLSAIWLLTAITRFIMSRRRNAAMLDSLVDDMSPADSASAEELAILQSKMQAAVDTLKGKNFSKKGGSRFIYELPWYTIIGPPGAGKTTLLSNSGLDFPLEDSHGKYSVKGVGGTRNCDWWFTDQAVLLDTAGRYTTQDSESEVDRSAWINFLNLLKAKRSRRPINGVLVVLSVQDIIQSDSDMLMQSARTIRTRIDELYGQLGIAPPVYLVFSKCDLLAGFTEFFDDFDGQQRRQVWGFTLPIDAGEQRDALIVQELKTLAKTINGQSIEKLHGELSQRNRELVYSFPMQVNAIQPRVREFIKHLTARSRLLENVLFRGVYFTSATQSGSVFDEVIAKVSQRYGVDEPLAAAQPGEGKSFFIHRLLDEVVFRESGLAGTNLKTERRLARLQLGAGALVAAVLLGLSSVWLSNFLGNRETLARIEQDASALQLAANALPATSLDLFATNELLNTARMLPYGRQGERDDETGLLLLRGGLYQGDKVDALAHRKYDNLLIDALLPRLMVRLEHQMHAASDNSEFLFEALKTYQMIGSHEHFNAEAVIGWFNFDFDSNLPSDTPNAVRRELKTHVANLFDKRPYRLPRPLDSALISQYRLIAATLSTEQRAYNRIRNATLGDITPYYRLSVHASPEISVVFNREDGVSLDQSIPGFLTVDGYNQVFLPASKDITRTLADDSWVLGDTAIATQSLTPEQLEQAVKQAYFNDYIEHWDSLIQSVQLNSVDGLQQASDVVSLITDTDSPLKKLLVTIGEQTTLTRADIADDTDAATTTDRENQLNSLLKPEGGVAASLTDQTIDPVTRHFSRLHDMVSDWQSNTSQLDLTLNQLAEMNLQLLPMAQSPGGNIDPQLNNELAVTLQKLKGKAGRVPEPLASLMQGLASKVGDVVGGGFCQQLDTLWKTEVFAYYQRAISNRYPVNRNGTADIALADFGAFFGRGGVIDRFVENYLSTLVSRTPGQWTWIGKDTAVCVSDTTLQQLAFADDIKNTFFAQTGQTPAFSFSVDSNQLRMSSEINQLFLDVGGARMEYFHGPVSGVTSFNWPAANNQVSLRVEPVIPGSSSSLTQSGPWAVLRLFEQGARQGLQSGLTINYSFSGRPVTLALATSSFNPLNSVALRNFRAPENL